MKKIFTYLSLCLFSLGSYAADGDLFTAGDLQYCVISEADATVAIVGCINKPTGTFDVPSTTNNSVNSKDYTIVEIGEKAFSNCRNLTSVSIPNTVNAIGKYAFVNCFELEKIVLPQSITSISAHMMQGCRSLTSVNIPSSVTAIEAYAFEGCKSLTEIDIPGTVTEIGECAFRSSGLTSIAIPSGVTKIESYLFFQCSNLTSVELPHSIDFIGDAAFAYCTSLTQFKVSESVKTIEFNPWYCCTSLEAITVDGGNKVYKSIDGDVYTADGATLMAVPGATKSFTIPEIVTEIGPRAFEGCEYIESITLPKGIEKIGDHSFLFCNSLKTIIFLSMTPPNMATYTFRLGDIFTALDDATVYVPKGTMDAYKRAFTHTDARFTDIREIEAGVEQLSAPVSQTPVEYYNLNGVRVEGDAKKCGIYIKRQGDKTDKVIFK